MLEIETRPEKQPFFCGTAALRHTQLRKELKKRPSTFLKRNERFRSPPDFAQIGELLAVDETGRKRLSRWESEFEEKPLLRTYLYIGAARGIFYSQLAK